MPKKDETAQLSEIIIDTKKVMISELKEATYNPRKIKPQQLKVLKKSIKENGVLQPIIVNAQTGNTIISGHQRVRACKELGIDNIVASFVDLPLEKEKVLNLALNNISGENDKEKLKVVVKELADMKLDLELTGFRQDELAQLLGTATDESNDDPEYPITPYFSEKYDYVVIFTKNEVDFAFLSNALDLKREQSYKSTAVGLGRVVPFEKFEKLWKSRS